MDWASIGIRLAPILVLVFGLALFGGILAIRRARRTARTTQFGVVRERAERRGRQWTIVAAVLALLAAAAVTLWATSTWNPQVLPTPAPTATSTLIPSPTPRTPTVTPTPTATATVTPTPTATPVPPDAHLPSAVRTPFPTWAVTPGPDAALVDLVLAAGQRNDEPVGPTTRLPAGTERVYAFFTFDGMARGVPWVHVWYGEVEGQMVEVWSQVELWPYDDARGRTWRFFNCRSGRYELHVYVGQQLQQKVPFVVGGE